MRDGGAPTKAHDAALDHALGNESRLAEPLRRTAGPEPAREGYGAFASEILAAACWALLHTADDAIVRAVNLVGDVGTRGAVSGAPAGAWGGANALSSGWVDQFEKGAALVRLADRLLAAAAPVIAA